MLALRHASLAGRLDPLSIQLRPGEVTAICGPNGAGKSSLLALLAGLIRPESGAALLDDAPLAALPPRQRARAIGYLPQDHAPAWDIAVATLVRLGRLPHGADPAADARAVSAALAAMALEALAQRPCTTLSGGELARALLARVLAGEPQWLLADEPLASLDLAHQAGLMRQLRTLAESGTGVVVVLHDLATAMNRADRVIVLDRGAVVADGPPETALAEDTLAAVWGVAGTWLGERPRRALALDPA